MKKFAALIISLTLAMHLFGCTSKESHEDEDTAQSEEVLTGDSELENAESGSSEIAADETQAGFSDEQLPDQAMGDQTADQTLDQSAPVDSMTAESSPTQETGVEPTPLVGNDQSQAAPLAEEAPAPAPDTSTAAVDLAEPMPETPAAAPLEVAPEKPKASLRKVDDSPRTVAGALLNGVYIARPGDSYKSIAKMIYNDGAKQKDLKRWNPSISNPSAGDKIYYNSPMRADDSSSVKNFYEEKGLSPEVYVAKDGDNIRKVSKELLGYSNAWKEIWVTNPAVESKGELMAGTELRYWKKPNFDMMQSNSSANEIAATTTAPADLPPPPDMAATAPTEMAPPPPPVEELPPPPDMNAAATMNNDMPPPPPPMEMAPPPPPPMAEKPPRPEVIAEDTSGFTNDDMMMGLAGIGIIAAGVAALMVIRKRRQQKEMQAAFGDTQVGA